MLRLLSEDVLSSVDFIFPDKFKFFFKSDHLEIIVSQIFFSVMFPYDKNIYMYKREKKNNLLYRAYDTTYRVFDYLSYICADIDRCMNCIED